MSVSREFIAHKLFLADPNRPTEFTLAEWMPKAHAMMADIEPLAVDYANAGISRSVTDAEAEIIMAIFGRSSPSER